MRFARNAKIFRGHFDAAPVAGVFFLLVLFLLLNSSLVFPPGLRIQLPEAEDLAGTANPTVVVALDAGGQLYYEHQIMLADQLKLRLTEAARKANGPLTLVIQADREVKHDAWLRLNLLAREAGIHETLEATRPSLFPGPTPTSPER